MIDKGLRIVKQVFLEKGTKTKLKCDNCGMHNYIGYNTDPKKYPIKTVLCKFCNGMTWIITYNTGIEVKSDNVTT